jgi:hypothetical protein
LPAIQFNYNKRVLEIHGSTPYSLVFARRANDFFDYSKLDLTEEEKNARNDYFQKTHRISKSDYLNGSYVMIKVDEKGPKYKAKYDGPFVVLGREASGAYRPVKRIGWYRICKITRFDEIGGTRNYERIRS